jgi:predicted amidohydrolase YtcJ
MMTVDAASALGQDNVIGTIRPGKLADLVVLSGNPLTVPSDDIPGLDVLVTMIGGVARFCAPGAAALCPGS